MKSHSWEQVNKLGYIEILSHTEQMTMKQLKKWLPDRPPISVMVSLDCQKDILGDSSVNSTFLLILSTKEQVLNNMYILSHQWHKLTVSLDSSL